MSSPFAAEIAANLERAGQAIAAARQLIVTGYHDFAASRAYYAALLNEGLELSKHSAVIAAVHRQFVRTSKLSQE